MVADGEIEVALGVAALERPAQLLRQVIIPQLHKEMWDNLSQATRFRDRVAA